MAYLKGKDHPMYGKKHTKESRDKMSASLKGREVWNKGIKTVTPEDLKRYKNKWYLENRTKILQKRKISYFKNKDNETHKGYKRNYVKRVSFRYKEKNVARSLAKRFCVKKENCELCGDSSILEFHHWRYDRPLLVNTLCKFCHKVQHLKHPSLIYQ